MQRGKVNNVPIALLEMRLRMALEEGIGNEQAVESGLPQGRGESLIAQIESAVGQAEQLQDQEVQQQYNDQLDVLRPRKGSTNRSVAIELGCGTNVRASAVAELAATSAWLDRRQECAQAMGAADRARKDQDRADRAAFGEGRRD